MSGRIKDLIGQRSGRLVVTEFYGRNRHNKSLWVARCDCGGKKIVLGASIVNRTTRSCGCLLIESAHSTKIWKNHSYVPAMQLCIWHSYKRNAEKQGRLWKISIELLRKLLDSPCDYCGTLGGNTMTKRGRTYS